MKRILFSLSFVLLGLGAMAQNPYITTSGASESAQGVAVKQARTTLAVDVEVASERIVAGPYARYAQKFLGVRAPLSDKMSWNIRSAKVALVSAEEAFGVRTLAQGEQSELQHAVGKEEFSRFQIDKRSMDVVSTEEAAAAAARTIYSLRNHRMELITGEAGENVFGAGLKSALDEIARLEQAYLELFLGKQITTTHTERYIVSPQSTKKQYVVCRFNRASGLLPESDLSGDMVLLQIEPSGNIAVDDIKAGEKESNVMSCRVADPSTCIVMTSEGEITRAILPIFEFGTTVQIPAPRRK